MCNTKFFICETCGNIVNLVIEGGGTLSCCGSEMKELVANTKDAAVEKHVPEIEIEGNKVTVKVGSVTHPMTEEHYIQYIHLVTKEGIQAKCLNPSDEPKAVFTLNEGDEIVAAYEYCNLHGLWKKEQ